MSIQPVTVALGAFVGFLVGLTGMGGSSLMTPLLILMVGVKPTIAVGTDLIYSTITKTVGSIVHFRQKSVEPRISLRLAYGSVPGALLGVFLLGRLESRLSVAALNSIVLHLLGVMLVIVAITMALRLLLAGRIAVGWSAPQRHAHVILPLAGFAVGFLVGLTSVGSGTLLVVALTLCTRLPAGRLVGTDIFHAAILTLVAGLAHLTLGNVNVSLTASLLLGSVPGVLIGSRLCHYLPDRSVRIALACTLLVSGLRLI
jgi:uncharacterized membrane protein YfcA